MHNTGNPLGSKDILDLYDNSEVVDNFVNSQQDEVPDRFGTKRLTLAGLIKRSMVLRNEINDFSGALTFRPEWSDVPMNVSVGVGGEGGALNLQAEALGNRSEINKVTSREALRRSYAEAGYHLVSGSFEVGGVLVNANDVLLYEETGVAYAYSGTLPHTIGAGATPIGNPLWVAKDGAILRTEVVYIAQRVALVNSVAELKASFFVAGAAVTTRSYYNHSESDIIGAAVYDIVTAAQYGGTPDGYLDHALPNGLIARAQKPGSGTTMEMYGSNPNIPDSAPAFRAAMKSGNEVFLEYDCTFNSTLGAVPGVASGPCITLDAVSDVVMAGRARRLGRRPKIYMGPARAAFNNNFFTYYVSAASQAAGKYSQRNQLRNVELVFNRTPELAGNVSGVNTTSCEDFVLRKVRFFANGMIGTLAVPGTGGLGNRYEKNEFVGVSTCFDNSQFQDCVFEGNKLLGQANAVTGFNHFYDVVTLPNVRLSRPLAKGLGNNNVYRENEVLGYGTPFAIRGMQDSRIVSNHIHSLAVNDATQRNMISVYTETDAANAGLPTSGIIVRDNNIHDIKNTGGGTTRGVFIHRTPALPVGPCIVTENIISNMPNGIGISQDDDSSIDRIFNNLIDAATVGTLYARNQIVVKPGGALSSSPAIEATDGDLILKGGAGRYVRFGVMTSTPGTMQGYISIRDEAGNIRKLAVVS